MNTTVTLKSLLNRYLRGECSNADLQQLAEKVNNSNDKDLRNQLETVWFEYNTTESLSEEDTQKILTAILSSKDNDGRANIWTVRRKWFLRTGIAAACIVILAGIGAFLNQTFDQESIVITAKPVNLSENVSYVRNVLLQDSSIVILQANSTIEILSDFKGSTREIRLVGEAFFDIKRDTKRPFIIYSSELKTTVLGTAFNIKAWPNQNQIQVTVTRGKVRVENTETKKILADLSRSEKIEYSKTKIPEIKHIDTFAVKKTVDWIKQDMEFNEMNLKEISVILSKRYNVDIEIHGSKLAETLVVASFIGTEPLEEILKVLCSINSSTYTMGNGKVNIYQSKK